MTIKRFDSRQSEHRSALEQLTGVDSNKTLKQILPAIDLEVTPPFALRASNPSDLILNISSNIITNPETLRKRTNQPINNVIFDFAGGTITFPSVSGNDAVPSAGQNVAITITNNEYLRVLIEINEDAEIVIIPGAASNAVKDDAEFPEPSGQALTIGYITLFNNAGTIENITDDEIVQFTGGGGAGGGGTISVIRDKVEGQTGYTITFNETFSFNSNAHSFYRNGVLMKKVDSFQVPANSDISIAHEYMEVNNAGDSTQITLNPNANAQVNDAAAVVDDCFELVNIENTFEGLGLAEKTLISARGFADNTGTVNCTISTVSNKTRLTLDGTLSYNPGGDAGAPRGDLDVEVNGQDIERLIVGENDTDGNVVYEEDAAAGKYVDIYEIVGGNPQPLPAETPIRVHKAQYRVAELDALNTSLIPAEDNVYDLGSAGNRWRDIHLGPGSVKMHDGSNNTEIKMEGGLLGFVQPSEPFTPFGSAEDGSIKSSFNNMVEPAYIDAPNTEIQNRAQVLDESQTLKSLMPVDRIMVNSLSLLQNEFGPNGQITQEIDSKDSRIRVVGNWDVQSTSDGTFVIADSPERSDPNTFVEITFYGTGINWLGRQPGAQAAFDVSVDGVFNQTVDMFTGSFVLAGRNYKQNSVFNAISGLSLGWHTVKLAMNSGNANSFRFYGFEILNEAAQSDVLPGTGYAGLAKAELASASSLPYKPAALTGTKGARVINYFDVDDATLKQAFTEVPASPSYLGSADHSDEELVRRINFREFGANRADDFSAIDFTDKDLAFTLDDGTTTLVANNVRINGVDDIQLRGSGSFITITFVGTGIDLFSGSTGSPTNFPDIDVIVDGNVEGTYTRNGTQPIVSGLPYGTHTVKILNNAALNTGGFQDILIYEPKRPTLPATAVELEDYNLMADFVSQSGNQDPFEIATGVLQKANTREAVYGGSGWSLSLDAGFTTGFLPQTNTIGDSIQISFFGSGIILRESNSASNNSTFELDGSSDFSAYTVNILGGGSGSFTAATGVYNGQSGSHNAVEITGLPLTLHTLKITSNTANGFTPHAFDVITPVHRNDPSLKIGNQSSSDERKFSLVQDIEEVKPSLGEAKAWLLFDQNTGNIIRKSSNISAVIDISAGVFDVYFETPFKDADWIAAGMTDGTGRTITIATSQKRPESSRFVTTDAGGSSQDRVANMIVFYGELADE